MGTGGLSGLTPAKRWLTLSPAVPSRTRKDAPDLVADIAGGAEREQHSAAFLIG